MCVEGENGFKYLVLLAFNRMQPIKPHSIYTTSTHSMKHACVLETFTSFSHRAIKVHFFLLPYCWL